MTKILSFSICASLLLSCVKDPNAVSGDLLFDVTIDGQPIESSTPVADNSTRYLLELIAKKGVEIQNDRSALISVSDGTILSTSNLGGSGNTTQATIQIQGGKGSVYFFPGKSAKDKSALSITVDNITQLLSYSIKPSEPDFIELATIPANPTIRDNIELTAYLLKSTATGSFVSNDLKVFFEVEKLSPSDSILVSVQAPSFAYSFFNDQTKLVTSKINILTDRKAGHIRCTAYYNKEDGTLASVSKIVAITQ